MFLYKGRAKWSLALRICDVDKEGHQFLIQCWTHVWDMYCDQESYVTFKNHFATRVLSFLQGPMPRVPKEILDFLRPMERRPDLGIQHNWGVFILHYDCIVIRFYGFPIGLHVLPRFVPMRIGFLEVI